MPVARLLVSIALALTLLGGPSCKERYVVGDHVMVEWEGADYPAVVLSVEGPARYRVHYDGYDSIWDENVNVSRIKGPIQGPVLAPPPPAKVVRRGGGPVSSAASSGPVAVSRYKVGTRVRVEWHGKPYSATIVEVLPGERYRVHYDGFGPEWDETIDQPRIVSPR